MDDIRLASNSNDSLEQQIHDAKERAALFSKSLTHELRAQESKALHDLQVERQKWLASFEEKNIDMEQLERELASTILAFGNNTVNTTATNEILQRKALDSVKPQWAVNINNYSMETNQIDTNSFDFINNNRYNGKNVSNVSIQSGISEELTKNGSNISAFQHPVNNAVLWDKLLNQYKEELTRLKAELAVLTAHNDKLTDEREQLLLALKNEQGKSQFRISQIIEYEDEKTLKIKKEESLKLELLNLRQELSQSKELIAKIQGQLRTASDRTVSERDIGQNNLRMSSESEHMKYEIKMKEREDLIHSYQSELHVATDRVQQLSSLLADTERQRDDWRFKCTATAEVKQRLELQVRQLLVEMQQLKVHLLPPRPQDHQIASGSSLKKEGNASKQGASSKAKSSRNKHESHLPPANVDPLSHLEKEDSSVTESRLHQLMEQYHQLPFASIERSQNLDFLNHNAHNNAANETASLVGNAAIPHPDDGQSVGHVDSVVREQYYQFNLQQVTPSIPLPRNHFQNAPTDNNDDDSNKDTWRWHVDSHPNQHIEFSDSISSSDRMTHPPPHKDTHPPTSALKNNSNDNKTNQSRSTATANPKKKKQSRSRSAGRSSPPSTTPTSTKRTTPSTSVPLFSPHISHHPPTTQTSHQRAFSSSSPAIQSSVLKRTPMGKYDPLLASKWRTPHTHPSGLYSHSSLTTAYLPSSSSLHHGVSQPSTADRRFYRSVIEAIQPKPNPNLQKKEKKGDKKITTQNIRNPTKMRSRSAPPRVG